VRIRRDHEWHVIGGGFDTYLQEGSLTHCWSGMYASGVWTQPRMIEGSFLVRD
jgi:hypothetical protein